MTVEHHHFAKSILHWYKDHGRKDLPWRQEITAYRVWVSEIMLQQTQVSTVIPYFERFLKRFPSIAALAMADENEVLHHWSGLGYYARARHLLKAAKMIHLQGEFPASLDGLMALPGIGQSTAGAILSIAFEKSYPILDANVKRVLCRYAGIDTWPGETKTLQYLWDLATQYTPSKRAHDYAQAMMDLGATLCTRRQPQCDRCPLQSSCVAYHTAQTTTLPVAKPKKKIPIKTTHWLILMNKQRQILFEKRPPVGLWGGLWSFPEAAPEEDITKWCRQRYGTSVKVLEKLPIFRHTFSHFHLDITPVILNPLKASWQLMEDPLLLWHNINSTFPHGLPTPVKKLLKQMQEFII